MAGEAERRYTEEEFALILRRALEQQELPKAALPAADGLTLHEIQAVAREVGVDPRAVASAAAMLPATVSTANRLLGGPDLYQFAYVAPGRLPASRFGAAIDAIRSAARHQGDASEAFGGFEWKTVGEVTQISVSVAPQEDHTTVRVLADRRAAAALTVVGTVLPAAFAIGVIGSIVEPSSAPAVIGLVTATLGSGLLAARAIWSRGTRRLDARLRQLLAATTRAVDEGIEPPGR